MPFSMWRVMFSMTTMASSTTKPVQMVQAVVADIHDAEGADERERNGYARDNGGPGVAEKSEDHEDDENDGNDQSDVDIVNGSANRGAAIDGDAEMQRRRNRSAENREDGVNPIDGFDHIGGWLAEDGQEHSTLSAGEAQVVNVRDGIVDFTDVL